MNRPTDCTRSVANETQAVGPQEGTAVLGRPLSAKCSCCDHEDANPIPRTCEKRPGVVCHACNPSTGEADTGYLGFTCQPPPPLASSRPARDCLKMQGGPELTSDLCIYAHTSVCTTHPFVNKHTHELFMETLKYLRELQPCW